MFMTAGGAADLAGCARGCAIAIGAEVELEWARVERFSSVLGAVAAQCERDQSARGWLCALFCCYRLVTGSCKERA